MIACYARLKMSGVKFLRLTEINSSCHNIIRFFIPTGKEFPQFTCTLVQGIQNLNKAFNCGKTEMISEVFIWMILHLLLYMSRLTMMYKIVNESKLHGYVQQKTRVTRSFHPKCFINLLSTSNTNKYSFFNRTVKEWNALPTELIELETLASFKSALPQPLPIFISHLFNWFTLALVGETFR